MRTSLKKLIGSRENEAPINEDSWDRWHAKFRKQDIERVKLDIENGYLSEEQIWIPEIHGTHEKKISLWSRLTNAFKQCLP